MKTTMKLCLLLVATSASAKDKVVPMGFTCTAADGSTKRVNIDIRRGRYDDGDGSKRLSQVTDNAVIIEAPGPFLMATPLGPILHSLTLDRTTLILKDETLMPDRASKRTMVYQCAMGPKIDFRSGRQF